jgi:hypothetical protein
MNTVNIAFRIIPFVLGAALAGCAESPAASVRDPHSSVLAAPRGDIGRVASTPTPASPGGDSRIGRHH